MNHKAHMQQLIQELEKRCNLISAVIGMRSDNKVQEEISSKTNAIMRILQQGEHEASAAAISFVELRFMRHCVFRLEQMENAEKDALNQLDNLVASFMGKAAPPNQPQDSSTAQTATEAAAQGNQQSQQDKDDQVLAGIKEGQMHVFVVGGNAQQQMPDVLKRILGSLGAAAPDGT